MKVLFIDESEKQKNVENKYFFCLCGLMIDRDNLIGLNNNLDSLRKTYNLSNLKDLRSSKGLDKIKVTKEIYEILNSNNAKVITTMLGDKSLEYTDETIDVYFGAFTFLIERFLIHLWRESKSGIIIFDSLDKKLENKLTFTL